MDTDLRERFVYDRQGRRTDVIISFPAYQKLRRMLRQLVAEESSLGGEEESGEVQRKRIRQLSEQIRKQPVWSEEAHPDLRTPEDSRQYVKRIRSEGWERRTGL